MLENTSLNSSAHVEEFTVPFDLMGLAIGSHGTNIQSARNMEGIDDIQVIESNDGQNPVLFKVLIIFINKFSSFFKGFLLIFSKYFFIIFNSF